MAAGDFVLIMQFIGTVFAQVFYALGNVYMGEFSLLHIFISILVLRIVLWFIGRSFGITIDTGIQDATDRTREGVTGFVGARYHSVSESYKNHRHKNRMKQKRYLESRRSRDES